ncbi:MAG: hypothetical protein Q4G05_00865 [Clostridia bacterium]|nr:hypothetical protein [Clostridia bacterium]
MQNDNKPIVILIIAIIIFITLFAIGLRMMYTSMGTDQNEKVQLENVEGFINEKEKKE